MIGKDDNLLDNLGSHKDEKSALEKRDIEEDDMDLGSKSLDIRNHIRDMLSRCIP